VYVVFVFVLTGMRHLGKGGKVLRLCQGQECVRQGDNSTQDLRHVYNIDAVFLLTVSFWNTMPSVSLSEHEMPGFISISNLSS